jgi:LCP family protein required for cell wall assembly
VLANMMRVVVALLGLAGAAALFVNQYANYALSNPSDNSADVKNAIKALDPAPQNLPDQPVNILVLGSDSRGAHSGARSDTLLLVRMDFNRGFISMLSFPRDLYVHIPGQGPNKINAAYSLGGTKLAIETVKALTGEPIQYFFNVDFRAFTRLVNDAGGVYLDIDRHYFNNNSAGGASFARIDIQPGYQRLNGSDALSYVRYRHTDSDFARIARQQLFLSELKRTSRSVGGVNNIVDAIHSDVTTNLKSPDRLKDFLLFALRTDKDRTARVTIPSTGFATRNGGQSVVLTTDSLIRTAVDHWKNPDFHSQAPVTALPPSKVTVEVFNGTNRIGLANTTGRALQAKCY